MSVTVLSDQWHVARKTHRCNACCGTIGVGDRYRRQRNVDDDVFTFKAHALCDAAYWHIYREAGLFDDEVVDDGEVRDVLRAVFHVLSPLIAAGCSAMAPRSRLTRAELLARLDHECIYPGIWKIGGYDVRRARGRNGWTVLIPGTNAPEWFMRFDGALKWIAGRVPEKS